MLLRGEGAVNNNDIQYAHEWRGRLLRMMLSLVYGGSRNRRFETLMHSSLRRTSMLHLKRFGVIFSGIGTPDYPA